MPSQRGHDWTRKGGHGWKRIDSQHLPNALVSPIARKLTVQDLVSNQEAHAKRRVGQLFEETIINHNVYVIVDGMIRANDAVHGSKVHAPQELVDACGVVGELFGSKNQKWQGLLKDNREMIEKAIGFKASKHVL